MNDTKIVNHAPIVQFLPASDGRKNSARNKLKVSSKDIAIIHLGTESSSLGRFLSIIVLAANMRNIGVKLWRSAWAKEYQPATNKAAPSPFESSFPARLQARLDSDILI
jgi:hypothetical protein